MELVGAAERVAIFHRASHWDYPETGIYWVDINYIPGMKELFQGAAGADLRSVFITHTPQTFIAAADTVQAPAPWVWLPEPILREVGASHPLYLGVTDQLVTVASLLTGAQHTTHPLKNLKTFVGELCALPDPLWEHLWSDAMLQWLQKMLTHAERAAKKASKEGGSKLIQVSIDSCRIRVSPVGGAEKVLVLGPAPEDEGSAHVADSGTYLLDLLRRYDPKPFETHMSLRSLNGRKVLLLSDRSGWGRVGVTYF